MPPEATKSKVKVLCHRQTDRETESQTGQKLDAPEIHSGGIKILLKSVKQDINKELCFIGLKNDANWTDINKRPKWAYIDQMSNISIRNVLLYFNLTILFSSCKKEVKNVSANQSPGWPKHKLGRGRWGLASCQVSSNSIQWLRRSKKKIQLIRGQNGYLGWGIGTKHINLVHSEQLGPFPASWNTPQMLLEGFLFNFLENIYSNQYKHIASAKRVQSFLYRWKQNWHLYFLKGKAKRQRCFTWNLMEDVVLLPAKFRQNPFTGCREEVKNSHKI